MDIDTVTGFEIDWKSKFSVVPSWSLFWGDGAILAVMLFYYQKKTRGICKSSAHGAVEKVGSDSSEKRLPSKTAERRIVSALSMRRRYEIDGPRVNGPSIHAECLARA